MTDRRGRILWSSAQLLVWLVGIGLIATLLLAPEIGLHAVWDVLIPVAPALLVFAPGLWRNICPLGTTSLLPHRTGTSLGLKLSEAGQRWLSLVGIALLSGIVPIRHVVLNQDGPATALTLVTLGAAAFLLGWLFLSKSGWCSGACPIQPVERLYGGAPLATLPNAQCGACRLCVKTCPEAAVNGNGLTFTLLAGAFPGFVWGFFQVADGSGWFESYAPPFGAAAATLAVFLAIRGLAPSRHQRTLVRLFAALAVCCYYWYRIPMLFGFGEFPGNGMLIDLRGSLPEWFPLASRAATTLLFGTWFLSRLAIRRTWTVRPPLAAGIPEEALHAART